MQKTKDSQSISFGGGCHWCTEAMYSGLLGVYEVKQGWIKSEAPYDSFSEAVIVSYDPEQISQHTLTEIHLRTHSSSSSHSMRDKYRSAIYVDSRRQTLKAHADLLELQAGFELSLVTQVLPLIEFKLNTEEFLDYYQKNPEKPFCKTYIEPKLHALLDKYSAALKPELVKRLTKQ